MKPILYFDGMCGISGDMTVAALLDLGASRAKLDTALNSLALNEFHYKISKKKSHGIAGCDFDVILNDAGQEHCQSHSHHHGHRNLADVNAVIDRAEMTENARNLAKKIFRIVAEAESKAHACTLEEVHFHEVGAADSIADIVAASVLFDDLAPAECIVTGFAEGGGLVKCQHGALPVPVPAVLNIAQSYAIPLHLHTAEGELVTPTGIAIAAAFRTRNSLPGKYTILKTGTGLGKRDPGRSNLLRIMLLDEISTSGRILLLESTIDDSSGEILGLAMEKLLAAGALDVQFLPCFMKKNRPGYLLRILVEEEKLPAMEQAVFESTTTIGFVRIPVERSCMTREEVAIALPFGPVRMKKCAWNGITRWYPEYESVKALAETSGMDFRTIFEMAKQKAQE